MSPSNKKTKGKVYETKVADEIHYKLMTLNAGYKALFEDIADDALRPKRDYSSGNFLDSHGDINLGLAKKFFPFSIECKHWKSLDLSLNAMMKSNLASLIKIWEEQVLPKSKETGLLPLLTFKANRTEDFVFYDKGALQMIPIGRFVKIDNWIICLLSDFINEANRRMLENERPFRDWKPN